MKCELFISLLNVDELSPLEQIGGALVLVYGLKCRNLVPDLNIRARQLSIQIDRIAG